ncbi:hypothetical protein [Thalassovita sp.]|uniref:hypothetical protein n=1 Tax=Thalassovita sp. TaxID=1979401 RepID=UPI0029DE5688|nr:hypothetical protein [Thalassovita sp.]
MKRPAPFRVLWTHHRTALLLTGLALVIALVFAAKLAMQVAHWNDARTVQPEPWMTPGYVARSWRHPPEDILAALGLPEPPRRRVTLSEIADLQGRPVEAVIADLLVFLQAQGKARP